MYYLTTLKSAGLTTVFLLGNKFDDLYLGHPNIILLNSSIFQYFRRINDKT